MEKKQKNCPICRKQAQKEGNPFWPFCSKRCKTTDLGRWAKEEYRIPGRPADADVSEEEEEDNNNDSID